MAGRNRTTNAPRPLTAPALLGRVTGRSVDRRQHADMHRTHANEHRSSEREHDQDGGSGRDTIHGLLDRVRHSTDAHADRVSLGDVVEALGSRAFGPLLLLLGLIIISPIGDIPGASALLGLLTALVAVQLLWRRGEPWLPDWALRRSVRSDRVERSLGWLEKPAAFADRHLHPRLRALTGRTGRYAIALGCVFAALLLVPLEFVPGASTFVGVTLIAFGVSLVSHDGLAALLAFVFTAGAIGLIVWHFM